MATVVDTELKRKVFITVDRNDCTYELLQAVEKFFGGSPYFEGKSQILFEMDSNHPKIELYNQEICELVDKMIAQIKKEKEEEAKADEATYKKLDKLVLEDSTLNPLAQSIRVAVQHRIALANEFAENGQYTDALVYRNDAENLHAVFKFVFQCKWKRALQAYQLLDTIVREAIPVETSDKIRQFAQG